MIPVAVTLGSAGLDVLLPKGPTCARKPRESLWFACLGGCLGALGSWNPGTRLQEEGSLSDQLPWIREGRAAAMQGGQGGVGVEPRRSYWALFDALLTTVTVNGQV